MKFACSHKGNKKTEMGLTVINIRKELSAQVSTTSLFTQEKWKVLNRLGKKESFLSTREGIRVRFLSSQV